VLAESVIVEVKMSSKPLYERIATELHEIEQIQKAVEPGRPSEDMSLDGACVSPRTPTERWLAEVWAEFLGVEQVDIHTDFFELGGDSLAALRILSRVRDHYKINVPPTVLFATDFTVVEIAKLIEQHQIEETGVDEVAKVLEELESLSDEEVSALLAAEE
jgi:acyl carrier protein